MKLRKLLSLFLIVALLVGLTACTAEVNVNTDVEIRLPDNLMTTATEAELADNPRSRSAKLRCVEKIHERYTD